VAGRRAYALARAGADVELPEREVEVYRFEELESEGDRREFLIDCSSGTYVRSLVADLGDAYCEALRRTRIGPFEIAEADPERRIPLNEALARFMDEVRLTGDGARRASHGVAVAGEASDTVRLVDDQGLIALAEPTADGLLKPVVGLRG
jgi:tRNA pseudouridine55 synthase